MVAVILHLNPKALARGNALNVTILLVTFKADMDTFSISSDIKIWSFFSKYIKYLLNQRTEARGMGERQCASF